ncbi:odorant receptor 45b-like [Phlebotomus argentipes]|uniref:odorant receptor 45b-like n=1 Tax=Phlebotomus argentipes TaxID=94469 RepID=UPI0028932109|nr:odorant receptor 45b-like [Phlebotomus argentipes]
MEPDIKIMSVVKNHMEFCGVIVGSPLKQRIMSTFTVLSLIYFSAPQAVYYVLNMSDLQESTAVLSVLMVMVITGAKIYWLVSYTNLMASILTELQDHINTRVKCGKGRHYLSADRIGNVFTKCFAVMILCAALLYSLNPMLQILVQFLLKPEEPFVFKLPFHFELGIDDKISPNYELIYVSSFTFLLPILNSMVSSNCLFFCFSLHIAACFKDLQEMISDIVETVIEQEKLLHEPDDGSSLIIATNPNPQEEEIFLRHISQCLELHTKIIRWIEGATLALSGIIAFEYAGSILSFCTQAFQATLNVQSAEFLNSVVFFMANGLELFLFAIFGEKIATESRAVADAAYRASWWRFPPRYRRYFGLMIQRAQKPCYFKAANWLNCSMESYMTVLRASFSMMALLQNLNEKGGFGLEQEDII